MAITYVVNEQEYSYLPKELYCPHLDREQRIMLIGLIERKVNAVELGLKALGYLNKVNFRIDITKPMPVFDFDYPHGDSSVENDIRLLLSSLQV